MAQVKLSDELKKMKTPAAQIAVLGVVVDGLADEIRALRKKCTAIQEKGVIYRGVWQAAEQYGRGDLTTHKGSIWHANEVTRAAPGDGRAWTLAVKGGDR